MASRQKQDAPNKRSFRPRGDVVRVAVGADPRVSVGAGETYTTDDPRLADRLAALPELEEVNS